MKQDSLSRSAVVRLQKPYSSITDTARIYLAWFLNAAQNTRVGT